MRIPSLTLDLLTAVVALVERRTYVLAAEELSISVSAIQKRIRTAEVLLGQKLFVSTETGISLTNEGRVFYADALRTVEQALLAEERMKSLANLNARKLQIGHSTYLPPRLLGFVMRLDSDLSTEVLIQHHPGLTISLARRVVEGTLHAAFADLSISHPALLARKLIEEPVVVCVPKSHPLVSKPLIGLQDLNDVPMIAVGREPAPSQHEEIEEHFATSGVRLKIIADAFGPPEALTMVEQNMGVCLVGASAAKGNGIVAKQLSAKTLTRKIGLYLREDNSHPALHRFVDLVLLKLAQRYETPRQKPRSYRGETSSSLQSGFS